MLYVLRREYEAELRRCEEEGGEVSDRLAALELSVEERAEQAARAARNEHARASAYRAEAARLSAMARACERRAEAVKRDALLHLDGLGLTRVETSLGRLTSAAGGQPSVHHEGDPSLLPERFRRAKWECDRKAVLAYVAETEGRGELPPGVVVLPPERQLRLQGGWNANNDGGNTDSE